MCTYCEQHCVEDEPARGNVNVPENLCPDKRERITKPYGYTMDDIYAQGWKNDTIDGLIEELDDCESAKTNDPPFERGNPFTPFIDEDDFTF